MMPSMTATPNSATKPIAADTLNGMPDISSPRTPPKIAIGITLMASSVSTMEPKLNHRSTAISVRLIGTTIESRWIASCRLPNSPTHSIRDPGLDRGGDVARCQSVTRRARAIDIDLYGGLAGRRERRQVVPPLHRGQDRFDLVGCLGERLQIVPIQLDRVFSFYARHCLRDV